MRGTPSEKTRLLPSKDVVFRPSLPRNLVIIESERPRYFSERLRQLKTWSKANRGVLIVAALVLMLVIFVATYLVERYLRLRGCLPAPYIYLTSHSNNNIFKYSRDGCLLLSTVVSYGYKHPKELRGIAMGRFKGREVLYAADAAGELNPRHIVETSELLVIGPCEGYFHTRPYIRSANAGQFGSYHAYSIAFDKDGNVYASFQHTDGVVRFAKDTLLPMPFPKSMYQGIRNDSRRIDCVINSFSRDLLHLLPNGTFVQIGQPGVHNVTQQGIRSIAFIPTLSSSNATKENDEIEKEETLWIADEQHDYIFIVDSEANEVPGGGIAIHRPVGMYYDSTRHLVFIGSKEKKKKHGGAVYAIDPLTRNITHSFSVIGWLMHPTGIVVYEDVLFVAEQSHNVVATFNITTQRFIRNIVKMEPLTDPVEQIVLSPC